MESRGGTESREHRGGADWGVTLPPGREEKYCWIEVTRAGGSNGSGRRAGWKGGMEIVIVEIVAGGRCLSGGGRGGASTIAGAGAER